MTAYVLGDRLSPYFRAGVAAWFWYAVVETALTGILSWWIRPAGLFVPVHPGFTLIVLILLPLLGGCLSWVLARTIQSVRQAADEALARRAGLWSLLLVFSANVVVQPLGLPPRVLVLGVCSGIFVLSVSSRGLKSWRRAVTHPVAAALLLLTPLWLAKEVFNDSPLREKGWIAAAGIFLVVAVVMVAGKARSFIPGSTPLSIHFFDRIVAIGLIITALVLDQDDPIRRGFPRSTGPAGRPNVIFIVMDTVRADHLSWLGYGRETSPHLRGFARKATVSFRQ